MEWSKILFQDVSIGTFFLVLPFMERGKAQSNSMTPVKCRNTYCSSWEEESSAIVYVFLSIILLGGILIYGH